MRGDQVVLSPELVHHELSPGDPFLGGPGEPGEMGEEAGALAPLRLVQAPQPLQRGMRFLRVDEPVLDPGAFEPPAGLIHEPAQFLRPLVEVLAEGRRQWRPRRFLEHREPHRRREGVDDARPLGQADQIDDAGPGPSEPRAESRHDVVDVRRVGDEVEVVGIQQVTRRPEPLHPQDPVPLEGDASDELVVAEDEDERRLVADDRLEPPRAKKR
jgi:hypothetical protein